MDRFPVLQITVDRIQSYSLGDGDFRVGCQRSPLNTSLLLHFLIVLQLIYRM